MDFTAVRRLVIRHRFAIRNGSLVLLGTLVTLYCVFAIDLFVTQDEIGLEQAKVELDEALFLGTLLAFALLAFGARHYFAQKREMEGRVAAERHARELAYQDGLTGLPNRRQYDDALRTAIAAPPRAGASHGILLLDLNGFKRVNDVYGHGVGDEVLVVVSRRLSAAMRDGDMVARFGGDEFAILAHHLSGPEAATNIGLRVIDALEPPITAGGAIHRIGAGIGIALIPADANSLEEALRKADVALYRAKAQRRSALRFFEPEMDARLKDRARIEVALREAIDTAGIEATYLPIVDLKSHEVVGFEATPRWIDPFEGEIPLERFVAIADEVGLIHELGERVLRQACEAARDWPTHVALSVDIYPGQLQDPLLAARIMRILAESGFSPKRLELEVTESALVSDTENAQATLGALRAAGVRIAIDNFGTGYSSLYHLRNVKIDKVKIDRSFIQTMMGERESASIVRALVGLGHGLGLTIAAEGIEAPDQESSLIMTGCEQGQGHLFSGYLSAGQAADLFDTERQQQAG